MACERHEYLTNELQRIKNSQAELYSLDRTRTETMAEIREDIATLKAQSKHTKEKVDDLCEEVCDIKESLETIKDAVEKKRWQPKDIIALVTALLSSSVVGVIVSLLVGGVK